MANIGDKVQVRATSTNSATTTNFNTRFNRFDINGLADLQGNPQSILQKDNFASITTIQSGQLGQLFRYQPIVDASNMKITATTLDSFSIGHMFRQSTTLKKGPEIFATTLGNTYTMDGVFNGCSSLEEIKIHYTGNQLGTNVFDVWVEGVPGTGTFYYNGSSTTRGTNAIPTGWTVQSF